MVTLIDDYSSYQLSRILICMLVLLKHEVEDISLIPHKKKKNKKENIKKENDKGKNDS